MKTYKLEIGKYKFKASPNGLSPVITGDSQFNFDDPECMQAIESALEVYREEVPRPAYLYIAKIQDYYKIGISYNPETRFPNALVLIPFENKTLAFQYEHALHVYFYTVCLGDERFDLPEWAVNQLVTMKTKKDLAKFMYLPESDSKENPVYVVARRNGYNHYWRGSYSAHVPAYRTYKAVTERRIDRSNMAQANQEED